MPFQHTTKRRPCQRAAFASVLRKAATRIVQLAACGSNLDRPLSPIAVVSRDSPAVDYGMAFDAAEGLAEGIQQLHQDAAGVLDVFVVRPKDMPRLAASVVAGNRRSLSLAVAISDLLSGPAKVCVGCEVNCDPPAAVVLITPSRDDPASTITMAACGVCADGVTDAQVSRMAQRWLRRLWPELREIEAAPQEGRA